MHRYTRNRCAEKHEWRNSTSGRQTAMWQHNALPAPQRTQETARCRPRTSSAVALQRVTGNQRTSTPATLRAAEALQRDVGAPRGSAARGRARNRSAKRRRVCGAVVEALDGAPLNVSHSARPRSRRRQPHDRHARGRKPPHFQTPQQNGPQQSSCSSIASDQVCRGTGHLMPKARVQSKCTNRTRLGQVPAVPAVTRRARRTPPHHVKAGTGATRSPVEARNPSSTVRIKALQQSDV